MLVGIRILSFPKEKEEACPKRNSATSDKCTPPRWLWAKQDNDEHCSAVRSPTSSDGRPTQTPTATPKDTLCSSTECDTLAEETYAPMETHGTNSGELAVLRGHSETAGEDGEVCSAVPLALTVEASAELGQHEISSMRPSHYAQTSHIRHEGDAIFFTPEDGPAACLFLEIGIAMPSNAPHDGHDSTTRAPIDGELLPWCEHRCQVSSSTDVTALGLRISSSAKVIEVSTAEQPPTCPNTKREIAEDSESMQWSVVATSNGSLVGDIVGLGSKVSQQTPSRSLPLYSHAVLCLSDGRVKEGNEEVVTCNVRDFVWMEDKGAGERVLVEETASSASTAVVESASAEKQGKSYCNEDVVKDSRGGLSILADGEALRRTEGEEKEEGLDALQSPPQGRCRYNVTRALVRIKFFGRGIGNKDVLALSTIGVDLLGRERQAHARGGQGMCACEEKDEETPSLWKAIINCSSKVGEERKEGSGVSLDPLNPLFSKESSGLFTGGGGGGVGISGLRPFPRHSADEVRSASTMFTEGLMRIFGGLGGPPRGVALPQPTMPEGALRVGGDTQSDIASNRGGALGAEGFRGVVPSSPDFLHQMMLMMACGGPMKAIPTTPTTLHTNSASPRIEANTERSVPTAVRPLHSSAKDIALFNKATPYSSSSSCSGMGSIDQSYSSTESVAALNTEERLISKELRAMKQDDTLQTDYQNNKCNTADEDPHTHRDAVFTEGNDERHIRGHCGGNAVVEIDEGGCCSYNIKEAPSTCPSAKKVNTAHACSRQSACEGCAELSARVTSLEAKVDHLMRLLERTGFGFAMQ